MCESNVYLLKAGQEELFMEKVDRIIPGEDNTIFLENVFGERRQIKARIKEMELVHHRIILTEVTESSVQVSEGEWWLEPLSDHGHYHPGEEAALRLCQGHNMHASSNTKVNPRVFKYIAGQQQEVALSPDDTGFKLNLGENDEGIITVTAHSQEHDTDYYAKTILEIGHHNHQQLEPVGLPLEILPSNYQHAHIGEHYEITVLYHGEPLNGVKIAATYQGNRQASYPITTYTDDQGKALIFLAARGNYLLVCCHEKIVSTYTLIKSY